jgi:hypothetical protein
MLFTRRRLQLVLGGLWLLDGLLQLQPFMFGSGFARDVLDPAAAGQPRVVGGLVHASAAVVLWHPVVLNSAFALCQLALGVGLLWRPSSRLALGASVVWALGVWAFGEGVGGVLSGAGLADGAPGAALLYAVLACAAWPAADGDADIPPARWLAGVWAVMWVGFAIVELRQGVAGLPLASAEVVIGACGVTTSWWRVAAASAGAGVAIWVWVTTQSFGGLATGQATDPGTAPLIAVFAVALVAGASRGHAASRWAPAPRSRRTILQRAVGT